MICTGTDGVIYHVSKFLITHIDEINSRIQIKNIFVKYVCRLLLHFFPRHVV